MPYSVAVEEVIMPNHVPASPNFVGLGMDLFSQVQRSLGSSKVRALRLKIGNHVIKEIPVSPLTTAATVVLVVLAVVVSTLSIEVDHEPAH